MEVDADDDYDRLSQSDLSDEEDDDFADAGHTTPSSTPPAHASIDRLIPSRTKRFHCSWDGCSKSFVRQSRLDEHVRTHTNDRPFRCSQEGCGKSYFRDSHLKVHIKSAHTQEKDYKCTWKGCDKSFATGQRFRNHLKVHEGHERYKCTEYEGCSESFRKKETLKRHVVAVHEKKKPFPCPDSDSMTGEKCTKEFDTAQKLRSHQKANHDEKRFSCSECLAENAVSLALGSNKDPSALKRAYFATMLQLQAHNAEFHPPTCPSCQAIFDTQKQLTAHLELVHDIKPTEDNSKAGKEEFQCPYPDCDKSYSKKGNLNVHVRTFHEQSLKFVCGQTQVSLQQDEIPTGTVITGCGKSFSSKQVLEDHVRAAHLGLQSLQSRRKRKASGKSGRKAKRARLDSRATAMDDVSTTNVSQDVPDFVWPAIGYEEREHDSETAMDLSASMSMLGSHIYHYGSAYHYPSGDYPSSSNSLEIPANTYQPVAEQEMDGFFGDFDQLQNAPAIDPRLIAAGP